MNKKYIIVGASSGIGLELTKELIQTDETVYALCRNVTHIPKEAHFLHCDVLDQNSPLPEINETIDGLVYLPGSITLQPFKQLNLETFRRDWEINLLGAVRVIQHYLPKIEESIVLMSSVAATLGMPYHASIGSAKSAVEGLTKALAAELAPKIRVNCVAPSLTDTPLAEKLINSDAKRQSSEKRHPLQRIGTTKDIASAIMFLLKDAPWISGQILHVDGGLKDLKLFS